MLSVGYAKHTPGYRFASGRELGFWTLEYFVAGDVIVRTSQGQHIYNAPSALLVPPHVAYTESADANERWTERFAIFDPPTHWHPLLSWPQSACGLGILYLSDSAIAREVEMTLRAALIAHRSARVNRRLLVMNALEKALLALDEINPARGHGQRDARIERALEYIAAQYASPLTLEVLARYVHLSPSRFAHLFKAQMRQSPMEYVEQYRLERAADRLLMGSDSVEQTARAVGYPNAFHFSTRFRRVFGQSPSRYRRNPGKM